MAKRIIALSEMSLPEEPDEMEALARVTRYLAKTEDWFLQSSLASLARSGKKKNGEDRANYDKPFPEEDRDYFAGLYGSLDDLRDTIKKKLENRKDGILKRFPLWEKVLRPANACGPFPAAWILGFIDIRRSKYVTSVWQLCGLASHEVHMDVYAKVDDDGNVVIPEKAVIDEDIMSLNDRIQGAFYAHDKDENGEKKTIAGLRIRTDTMIRGDRMPPKDSGGLIPYNAELKQKLCYVLGESLVKSQGWYYHNIYLPRKLRTSESTKKVKTRKKGGGIVEIEWRKTTDDHRHNDARRVMVKEWLKDLYKVWRAFEGLPVYPPYEEAKLGFTHGEQREPQVEPEIIPFDDERIQKIVRRMSVTRSSYTEENAKIKAERERKEAEKKKGKK